VVQIIGGKTYVVVDDDGQLRDQPVVVGLVGDTRTEILEGLAEGMSVVGP
jgi:multidrug efflux pump subunit AcrA (membrane-fusion protein)